MVGRDGAGEAATAFADGVDGKGAKNRLTMLPLALIEPLRAHLAKVRALVATTMIYTHVLNRVGRGVASPLDWL